MRKPVAWALTAIPPIAVYFLGIKNFADVLVFAGDTDDLLAFIILLILIILVRKFSR